jgi:hypothetical protein
LVGSSSFCEIGDGFYSYSNSHATDKSIIFFIENDPSHMGDWKTFKPYLQFFGNSSVKIAPNINEVKFYFVYCNYALKKHKKT